MTLKNAVLILAAGDISWKLDFLKPRSNSPALIPVNMRSLSAYVIDFYLQYDNIDVFLVIDSKAENNVRNELNSYQNNIKICIINNTESVVDTLRYSLKFVESTYESVIVNIVTTIPSVMVNDNEVLIDEKLTTNNHWACISVNDSENIKPLFFPKSLIEYSYGFAFTGIFKCLTKTIQQIINNNHLSTDLISIVEAINSVTPLNLRKTHWIDCGHLINFYDAKRKLISSRVFNRINISDHGTVIKYSINVDKLIKEKSYFNMLPEQLTIYYPRIISSGYKNDEYYYEMEYYGYPNVSELQLYWNLPKEIWERLFDRLYLCLNQFKENRYSIGKQAYKSFYIDKLRERFENYTNYLIQQGSDYSWIESAVYIDDIYCLPLNSLWEKLESFFEKKYNENMFCCFHGDFCFNNILYDINSSIVKLIDPRGSFGETCVGIYGDFEYDIAKLAHSTIGKYDYLVNNLFTLNAESNIKFKIDFDLRDNQYILESETKSIINKFNLNIDDILVIMGTLFLSMAPLHSDSYIKSKTMYLHGLKTINILL